MGSKKDHIAFENKILELENQVKQLQENSEPDMLLHYKVLWKYSSDMIFLRQFSEKGDKGYFIDINEAVCKKLGFSRKEMLTMTPKDIMYDPENIGIAKEAQTILKNQNHVFEKTFKSKKGELIHVEINSHIFDLHEKKHVLSIARDVTSNIYNQQKVKKSEELAKIGFWGAKFADKQMYMSDNFFRLLGYEPGTVDATESLIASHIMATDRSDFVNAVKNAVAKKENFECTVEYFTKTEERRWAVLEANVSFDSKGELIGYEGIFKDITEEKLNEQHIAETAQKYQSLVDNTRELISEADENGVITFVNRQHEKELGYKQEELVGKGIADFLHPDDLQPAMKRFKGIQASHGFAIDTWRFCHKNGYYLTFECRATVFQNYKGERRTITISTNVSSERAVQEELIEKENRLKAFYSNISDPVFVHRVYADGSQSNFLEVNESACEKLGYSREELLNMGIDDIDDKKTKVDVVGMSQKLFNGEKAIFEQTHISRDGKKIPVEINATAVLINGEQTIISIARDLTERKQQINELEKSNEMWKSLVKNSPDHIALLDENANVEYVNKGVGGLSVEDILGQNFYDLLQKDYKKGAQEAIETAKRENKILSFETEYIAPDGQKFYFENRISPIMVDGEFHNLLLTSTNRAEQKQAEQTVKETQIFMESILENVNDGIWVSDSNDVIVYANTGIEKIAGIPKDSITGNNVLKDFSDETVGEFKTYYLEAKKKQACRISSHGNHTCWPKICTVWMASTTVQGW